MPAGRRHHDRRLHPRAEQGHAGVDLDDVAQHARAQLQLPPRRDILFGGDFVVSAGVAEHPRFRPHHPLRVLLQCIQIDTVPQHEFAHFPLFSRRDITPLHIYITEMRCPAARRRGRLGYLPLPGVFMPSARPSTADKRKTFRELHESGCFVIPNPWNVGSARYLQGLGFKALATTSSGHAHSRGLSRRRAKHGRGAGALSRACGGDRHSAERRFRERLRRRSRQASPKT